MTLVDRDDLQGFIALFKGNPKAYGVFDNRTAKAKTVRSKYTDSVFQEHLTGKMGLGTIPLLDINTSRYGCLDFDNHKKIDGVDLIALSDKIDRLGLPLVVCRSRSGGAHAFLFGSEPLNTGILRRTLRMFADKLTGFGEIEVEIFPKQDRLEAGTVGNWLNLPYFNANETNRYAISQGKQLTLKGFLSLADSRKIDNKYMVQLGTEMHDQAPPCVQSLIKTVLDEGGRNIALFNYCVYVKKAFPDSWKDQAYDYNAKNFKEPLTHDEATSVIKSVEAKEYRYKCSEEPCKSRCNSSKCVVLKYGITPAEKNELVMTTLPQFGRLRKYVTDPVRYELAMNGTTLTMSTSELLDFRLFKKVVFEKLDMVLKPIKGDVWLNILEGLIENIELVDVPDDVSVDGIIRACLLEYLRRANLKDSGKDIESRKLVNTGRPVVQRIKNQRYVLFKGIDFRKYIQSKKIGNVVASNIFFAIRPLGVDTMKIRVDKRTVHVWGIPLQGDTDEFSINANRVPDVDIDNLPSISEMKEFKPEF